MRITLSLLFLFLSLTVQAEVSAIYGKYAPTGSVRSAQPTLTWNLTPTGGGKVSHVDMTVNEKAVRAEFNEDANLVQYKPAEPLAKGLYTVVCRVTIARELTVRQEWTFEVSGGPSPAGTVGASYALEVTNQIRLEMGMPVFPIDPRISAAAAAHCRYQVLNHQTGHVEEPGKPGFSGKMPWDRIQRFGYNGTCYEGACGGQTDPRKAIRLLFDAPYHRIAFLQPGSPAIGIGFEAGSLTIDYAVSDKEGVGLSPAPNQNNIPLGWDGNESPCPLRVHGAGGSCGYPIVFAWFSPNIENIQVHSMRLTGPSGPVEAYVNTPSNDSELRFGGIITPKTKLQPNTKYTVDVKATTESGKKIDRTWSFTTGS